MTELSDLKHNLCEKQAKIESLESELATLKGNYKTDSESTRNKLESIDIMLTGQGESIIELKQST
jgi:predicted RNase H-like nuclease (RuvC/YqgF family)